MVLESLITCPRCKAARRETMPTDACQFFYECIVCGARFKPKPVTVAFSAHTAMYHVLQYRKRAPKAHQMTAALESIGFGQTTTATGPLAGLASHRAGLA